MISGKVEISCSYFSLCLRVYLFNFSVSGGFWFNKTLFFWSKSNVFSFNEYSDFNY